MPGPTIMSLFQEIQDIDARERYERVIRETIDNLRGVFLDAGATLDDLEELERLWKIELDVQKPEISNREEANSEPVNNVLSVHENINHNVVVSDTEIKLPIETATENGGTLVPAKVKLEILQVEENDDVLSAAAMEFQIPQISADDKSYDLQTATTMKLEVVQPVDMKFELPQANECDSGLHFAATMEFDIPQIDGNADSSDEDNSSSSVGEEDNDLITVASSLAPENFEVEEGIKERHMELDPAIDGIGNSLGLEREICSDDDLTDFENEKWDTNNHVYCVIKKLSRTRDVWKLELNDGIIQINGKEYFFTKAHGEANW